MEDVKKTYSQFHKKNSSNHLYPTEWVIRTMLGNYPELKLDRSKYKGGKILDIGFGDCRNMPLLNNCGLDIYGVEITDETVSLGYDTLKGLNIDAQLKVGSNSSIPFEDNYFDYILSCASCYYVDEGNIFEDNLKEITRVLKPGGYFIANFPAFSNSLGIADNFILKNCISAENGHVIIKGDVFNLRNGYKFKVFHSNEDLVKTFSNSFTDISIGDCFDNYFGLQINAQLLVAKKK